MMRIWSLLIALGCIVNSGCKSEGCESKADCPAGQVCTDGVCGPFQPVCPNPPCVIPVQPKDAGPDAGVDASMDAGLDGGGADANDGGMPDGGDGGTPDGGDAGDAGDGSVSLLPIGEVWVAELTSQQPAFTTFAEFRDRRSATFDTFTREYVVPNASCGLERVTLLSGQVTGIETDRVTIDLNNGQMLTYLSTGDGRYEPQLPPSPGIFNGSSSVDFQIVSNEQAGTLEDATATTPAPGLVGLIAPPAGAPQVLAQGVSLSWLATQATDNRRTMVEIRDADRDVRLACRLMDDTGSFTVPIDAINDFLDQSPTQPYTLELRYEYSTVVNVGIGGSGDVLPVIFHAARGVRWPAQ